MYPKGFFTRQRLGEYKEKVTQKMIHIKIEKKALKKLIKKLKKRLVKTSLIVSLSGCALLIVANQEHTVINITVSFFSMIL